MIVWIVWVSIVIATVVTLVMTGTIPTVPTVVSEKQRCQNNGGVSWNEKTGCTYEFKKEKP